MPIYLRKYYAKTLVKTKETEAKQIEKARSTASKSNIARPGVKPKFKR